MGETFFTLVFIGMITLVVNAVPAGVNNVDIREIRAAEIHCSSHGGIKHFDNDYIREVVCADGLVTRLKWVTKKYNPTP